MKLVPLQIAPDDAKNVPDGWQLVRQRDFTGGENLSSLPEAIARNQFIKAENVMISPEGYITDTFQTDTPLFLNANTGVVVAPIPGSTNYRVYAASGNNVVSFIFDPKGGPYDMLLAATYPGYVLHSHVSPVTISGITQGTPFLGKMYCCAYTDLYVTNQLSLSDMAFGTATVTTEKSVTLTNNTANPVTLTGFTISGTNANQFTHDATFPQTIEAAGTYTFNLIVTPTTPGSLSATLNVNANIGILTGGISATVPTLLTADVSSHDFGTVTTVAPSFDITLTNTSSVIGEITKAHFSIDNVFSLKPVAWHVNPGESTTVTVMVAPTVTGAAAAALTIESSLGNVVISLSATIPSLLVGVASHDFGTVKESTTYDFAVTNISPTDAEITSIALGGNTVFSVPENPPDIIPAGVTLTTTITCVPTNDGTQTDTLTISTSLGDIALDLSATIPALYASPESVNAGTIAPISFYEGTLTIGNATDAPISITGTSASGDDAIYVGVTTTLPKSVPANGTATLDVIIYSHFMFNPATPGAHGSTLTVTTSIGDLAVPYAWTI